MPAGTLRALLAFDKRGEIDDGYGNTESGFAEQYRSAASLTAPSLFRGKEEVLAARLSGVQPWLATIRYSAAAAGITTDWRARDVRTGQVYAITTVVVRPRMDYVDIMCTTGRAA